LPYDAAVSPTPATVDRLDRGALRALLDASRAVNDELDPDEVCRLVAEHAAAVLDAEGSSVLLHDAARDELVFQTVIHQDNPEALVGQRFPAEKGIAGQVLKTGRAVRIDDVRDNRNFFPEIDERSGGHTRNLMAVPLVHHGETLGVVEVVNRRGDRPFESDDLELLEIFANVVASAARRAQDFRRLSRDNESYREDVPPAQFVGRSKAFREAEALCAKVAPATTTVLLTGETGTGKEMAARAIWSLSPRADRPFVAMNCAALPDTLVESELFGHEAGAFTGATEQRRGRFELADGGTLMLDEIGELDLNLQAKLLRVLESGEITRVGGSDPVLCDVRIIAATNRDLKAEAEAGRFREDLYYRLGVFPIRLPPLRQRIDDLSLLAEHLLAQIGPSVGGTPTMGADVLACLSRYAWPGNVRELRNVLERAALLSSGVIEPEHLPPEIVHAEGDDEDAEEGGKSVLDEQEHRLVLEALEQNNWNQSAAARQLGITRDILRYRVKRYGLKKSR
jgi:Nif-specific regulatory protein